MRTFVPPLFPDDVETEDRYRRMRDLQQAYEELITMEEDPSRKASLEHLLRDLEDGD